MLKRLGFYAALFVLLAAPAFAQARGEVTGTVGWTFSDGVTFTNAFPVNGSVYDRADPKDSASFGFGGGVFVNHQVEIEFMWNRQPTKLEVTGNNGPMLSGDMNVDTYHGNFVFNAGEEDAKLRPFVYFGLGATNYGDAKFPGKILQGITKFSWAIGAGVKVYPAQQWESARPCGGCRPTSRPTATAGGAIPSGAARRWATTPAGASPLPRSARC